MNPSGKTIVVTGGGNGIGRELVLQLLRQDAHVAAVDMNEKALTETMQLAGDKQQNLSTHVVNITDRQQTEALPDAVIARHGNVDGLINNAGIIQPFVRVNDLDFAAIERVMNVNFYGTLNMIKAFLPHLLKRPEAHIVDISSMGGFLPVPGQSVYGASKAAVKLLTEALYSELLNTPVRVTVVFPGAIGTNIAQNSGVAGSLKMDAAAQSKAAKTTPPPKAAATIIDGMRNNKFRVLIGSDAAFMDKMSRLNPAYAARFIYKQMKDLLG